MTTWPDATEPAAEMVAGSVCEPGEAVTLARELPSCGGNRQHGHVVGLGRGLLGVGALGRCRLLGRALLRGRLGGCLLGCGLLCRVWARLGLFSPVWDPQCGRLFVLLAH